MYTFKQLLMNTPEKLFGTKQHFLSRIQLQMGRGFSLILLSNLEIKAKMLVRIISYYLFVLSVHYPPHSRLVLKKQSWVLCSVGVFAQVGSHS